jgi:hypothetical protein
VPSPEEVPKSRRLPLADRLLKWSTKYAPLATLVLTALGLIVAALGVVIAAVR